MVQYEADKIVGMRWDWASQIYFKSLYRSSSLHSTDRTAIPLEFMAYAYSIYVLQSSFHRYSVPFYLQMLSY
jgi:hypothetical protein